MLNLNFMALASLTYLFVVYVNALDGPSRLVSNVMKNTATIDDFTEGDVFFEILYPPELQYTYRIKMSQHFGTSFNYTLKNVRLVITDPEECCSFPKNANELKGSIALATRSQCSFVTKTVKAQEAGALGVIVTDNNIYNNDQFILMADDETNRSPTIPAAFLLGASGHMIKNTLRSRGADAAIINIPINMTHTKIQHLNEPPWIVW